MRERAQLLVRGGGGRQLVRERGRLMSKRRRLMREVV